MIKEKVNATLMTYKDQIPSKKVPEFRSALENASDDAYDALSMAKTYKPAIVVILSIFFGFLGIDRFVIGDIGLGVAKLLVGWLTFGLWPLIDIFFCYRKAKEKNLENLLGCL